MNGEPDGCREQGEVQRDAVLADSNGAGRQDSQISELYVRQKAPRVCRKHAYVCVCVCMCA